MRHGKSIIVMTGVLKADPSDRIITVADADNSVTACWSRLANLRHGRHNDRRRKNSQEESPRHAFSAAGIKIMADIHFAFAVRADHAAILPWPVEPDQPPTPGSVHVRGSGKKRRH